MDDLKRLLDLMFEPNEEISVSDGKWGYHSMPISSVLSGEVTLVSPNQKCADRIVKTDKLILMAINSLHGFRKDSNVLSHRTFLWEIDDFTLEQQKEYVKNLGLPVSAAIYSGNKSIHFATVLEEPIDLKTYSLFYKWALSIGTLFDKNCKNPTRSIRIPGAIRPETGNVQQLLELNGRVKLKDFAAWLGRYEHLRPKGREQKKDLTNERDYDRLSPWARNQMKYGVDLKNGRNRAWFSLACDLYRSGYDEDGAVDVLSSYFVEENDFKEKEFLTTIKSAFQYMVNKD